MWRANEARSRLFLLTYIPIRYIPIMCGRDDEERVLGPSGKVGSLCTTSVESVLLLYLEQNPLYSFNFPLIQLSSTFFLHLGCTHIPLTRIYSKQKHRKHLISSCDVSGVLKFYSFASYISLIGSNYIPPPNN